MTQRPLELPDGFRLSGITCGIKKSGKPDLALVVADSDCVAAGVYTQNQVVAAPVVLSRSRTPGNIRAVVVNSGNANACTGDTGMQNAIRMTELVGQAIGCDSQEVVVMSTGIIGHQLPMAKIESGVAMAVDALAAGETAFLAASDAILTTDIGRKVLSISFEADGKTYKIAGMCKGAGMIGPNMATMLGLVLTDFPLSAAQADAALHYAADRSFNCISVEGHTSTNDSLVLMSSAGQQVDAVDEATFLAFQAQLTQMCIDLAKQIPADGEGATHVIEINVQGALTNFSAKRIAKTISESALVKTAIHGGDPNWGRIVSAAGYAGEVINPSSMALTIQGIEVYAGGTPVSFDAKSASEAIKAAKDVKLVLKVGDGDGEATFWTSDLTVDYVRFNSEYTT